MAEMSEKTPPFFLLTGPPGAGKSSLLTALASSIAAVPEPARLVLERERASGGTATGEQNAGTFIEKMMKQAVRDYEAAQGLTLFDRGLPDLLAYCAYYGVPDITLKAVIEAHRYQVDVFWCPAWAEVYRTDAERTLDFAGAVAFGARVQSAYEEMGYNLIEMPFGTVDDRAAFIRARLSL